jgi:hypothetical protein
MSHLSSALFLLGVLCPPMLAIVMRRYRYRPHWSVWLLVSAVLSWLCLVGGDAAYHASLKAEYERTQDPELLARWSSDAGSGILFVFGSILTLIWSVIAFSLVWAFMQIPRILKFKPASATHEP